MELAMRADAAVLEPMPNPGLRTIGPGDVERAFNQGEFVAAAQPFVHVLSGTVVGAELLARWQHPTRGTLYPGQFLPLIEALDRLPDLTDVMLVAASTVAAPGRFVSVNLSPADIARGDLAARVDTALGGSGVDHTQLCAEVVESELDGAALATLVELKHRGVLVAVDDFGTAFSSLARVIELTVDLVKLDRSLLVGIETRPRAAVIVRAVVDAMHELGAAIVAEGVETEAEAETAVALGCDIVQGYVFGRPVPVTAAQPALSRPGPLALTDWLDVVGHGG